MNSCADYISIKWDLMTDAIFFGIGASISNYEKCESGKRSSAVNEVLLSNQEFPLNW